MSHRQTAIQFIERFCAGDVEALNPLLCDDLKFTGPFYQFDSRDAYLAGLADIKPYNFQLLSVTQGDESVAVFYEYQKTDRSITIAQLFRFRGARVCEITLIFDGRSFQ